MPWTTDDVAKHKKGLGAKMTALWLKVANPTREECMEDGGDEKECDAIAIRNANAVVGRAMKEAELADIATSAVEAALAVVNDSGEIDRETANQFLEKLQEDLKQAKAADWSAKKGGRIRGNLYRGGGGKFSGGGGDAGGSAEEAPATDLGIDTKLTAALAQIASGKGKTDQAALAKLQSLGLATETGGLNTYGRAVLKATKNEDADEIKRVMGLAGAKQAAKAERDAKRAKTAAKRKKQQAGAKEKPTEEPAEEPGAKEEPETEKPAAEPEEAPEADTAMDAAAAAGVTSDAVKMTLDLAAGKTLNPRALVALADKTGLVEPDGTGEFRLSAGGKAFVAAMKKKDAKAVTAAARKAKPAKEAEAAEVGRRLNQQRVSQLQGVIDSLQAKLKDFESELGDLEDMIQWASYADREQEEEPEKKTLPWAAPTATEADAAEAAKPIDGKEHPAEVPPAGAPEEVESMEKEQVQELIAALAEDGLDLDAARQQAQALLDSLSAPEAEPEAGDPEKEPAAEPEAQEAETAESETVEADLAEVGGDAGILGLAAEAQPAEGVNPDRAPLGVYVNVIKPGWGNHKDNRYYPPEMLKRDAGVFEGAKMYTTDHRGGEKSERTEVSVIEQCPVYFAEDGSPVALARIFDPDFAEKTRNRARAGQLQTLRCSIYAKGSVKPGYEQGGRKGDLVEAIKAEPRPDVDWVTRDGAGGHAVAMAESESEPEPLAQEAVEAALAEAKLPQVVKDWVAEGTYADEAQLQEAVKTAVERVKKLTGSGEPFGQGASKPVSEQTMTEAEYDEAWQKRIQEPYHLSQ